VAEGKNIGIKDFIEKPFTTKAIEETLSRLIENREPKGEKILTQHLECGNRWGQIFHNPQACGSFNRRIRGTPLKI